MVWYVTLFVGCLLAAEIAAAAWIVRRKHLDRWLSGSLSGMKTVPQLVQPVPRRPETAALPREFTASPAPAASGHATPWQRFVHNDPLHVFIAVCDHYEPDNARPARHVADARVDRWCREYPQLFRRIEDSRGRPPQHSFFFPQDEYFEPRYLDQLKQLCEAGFGDVEIHLHHDHDTADGLREKLESFRDTLWNRHGLLRRDPLTGQVTWGFIHGNWALCNSREDGRWCGVNDELTVLRETGCYADFTMPSAPEATQTRIINSLYYARSEAGRPGGHDAGIRCTQGCPAPDDRLLMVQGPLQLDWHDHSRGLLPRIENGDLLHRRPPTMHRFQQWLQCGVHVAGRPDWCFIKLHTHGCKDGNIDTLLGPDTLRFHQELMHFAAHHWNFRFYYVTAWEMSRLIHQAEAGRAAPDFKQIHQTPLEFSSGSSF